MIDQGWDVDEKDVKNKHCCTALGNAVIYGRLPLIKLLLSKGAEVNRSCERGCIPICRSLATYHLDAAQMLLDAGADPEGRCGGGHTPLEMLLRRGKQRTFLDTFDEEKQEASIKFLEDVLARRKESETSKTNTPTTASTQSNSSTIGTYSTQMDMSL